MKSTKNVYELMDELGIKRDPPAQNPWWKALMYLGFIMFMFSWMWFPVIPAALGLIYASLLILAVVLSFRGEIK